MPIYYIPTYTLYLPTLYTYLYCTPTYTIYLYTPLPSPPSIYDTLVPDGIWNIGIEPCTD